MIKKILGLWLVIFFCMAGLAFAGSVKPIQLGLFNPIQLFPADDSVCGLRFNLLYCDNVDMTGLSLSSGWTRTTLDMKGIQLGPVNWVDGVSYGWQVGLLNYTSGHSGGLDTSVVNINAEGKTGIQIGVTNWGKSFFHGWQIGLVNYLNGRFMGFETGFTNIIREDFSGLQIGTFNFVGSVMTGLQIGAWNNAREVSGVQIGVINACRTLNGVQIGLGNYNDKGNPMPFMIVVNWAF
jgi:hypothetical protein